MLKRAIALTAIGIVIVFGVIATILIVKPFESAGKLTVHYNNGLAGNLTRETKRTVPLYTNEDTNVDETRENKTQLLKINKSGFNRDGYTFGGWRHGFDGEVLKDGYVPGGLTKNSGIVTFVATWIPNTYMISFNPEYPGLIAPSSIEVTVGEPMYGIYSGIYIPDQFVMGELVFKGWRTQKNGKGKFIEDEAVCNFTSHTMLYGWWVNPNDPTAQRTVTVVSAAVGGGLGPFYSYQEKYPEGTELEFWLYDSGCGFDEYYGYQFAYFMVGSQKYTKADFGSIFMYTLNSNTTITIYYNIAGNQGGGNQTQWYTLTVKSAVVGHKELGPFDTYTKSYRSGMEIEFWLYDYGRGFDEYCLYYFAYFQIGNTKYSQSNSSSFWDGDIFWFIITGHTTVTVYYY